MTQHTDQSLDVEILCTVVPGGKADEEGTVQNISIVVSPYVAPVSQGVQNWSTGVSPKLPLPYLAEALNDRKSGKFVLFLHTEGSIKTMDLGYGAILENKSEAIGRLWERAFGYERADGCRSGFELFYDILSPDSEPPEEQDPSLSERLSVLELDPAKTLDFPVAAPAARYTNQRIQAASAQAFSNLASDDEFEAVAQRLTRTFEGDKPNLEQAIAAFLGDLKNRPFARPERQAIFNELKQVLLSGGTDSASGRLDEVAKEGNLLDGLDGQSELGSLLPLRAVQNTALVDLAKALIDQDSEFDFAAPEQEGSYTEFGQKPRFSQTVSHLLLEEFFAKLENVGSLFSKTENDETSEEPNVGAQVSTRDRLIDRLRNTTATWSGETEDYRAAHSHERGNPELFEASQKLTEKDLKEGVRRKIADLETQPTLSKLFRLIHDFSVKAQDFTWDKVSFVSAAFVPDDFNDWDDLSSEAKKRIFKTATVYDDIYGLGPKSRGPEIEALVAPLIPQDENRTLNFLDTILTQKLGHPVAPNGLLNLKAGSRFQLNILDTSQATHAMTSAATANAEADAAGATEEYRKFDLPDLRSRGIELLDEAARGEAIFDIELAQTRRNNPTVKEVLHAEDLMAGIRVDIGNAQSAADSPEYHPAMARSVHYPEVNIAFGKHPKDYTFHPFPDFSYRDEGFASQLTRIRRDDDVSSTNITSPRIAYWTGEPLSVSQGEAEEFDS